MESVSEDATMLFLNFLRCLGCKKKNLWVLNMWFYFVALNDAFRCIRVKQSHTCKHKHISTADQSLCLLSSLLLVTVPVPDNVRSLSVHVLDEDKTVCRDKIMNSHTRHFIKYHTIRVNLLFIRCWALFVYSRRR